MVGIIVEKDYTSVFNLTRHTLTNAIRGRGVFPVERVNIRYKSKEKSLVNYLLTGL